jgi:hypothetical protein
VTTATTNLHELLELVGSVQQEKPQLLQKQQQQQLCKLTMPLPAARRS